MEFALTRPQTAPHEDTQIALVVGWHIWELRTSMPGHRYTGRLNTKLREGEDAEDKIPLLFKDLGVSPSAPDAFRQALHMLAQRHVPGFRLRGNPGRRPALHAHAEQIAEEYGSILGDIAIEGARVQLWKIVNRARKTWRAPGGRRYTQFEIVTKISEWESPYNIYWSTPPRTLQAWVSHSGPNSELQKKRDQRTARAVKSLKSYLSKTEIKA